MCSKEEGVIISFVYKIFRYLRYLFFTRPCQFWGKHFGKIKIGKNTSTDKISWVPSTDETFWNFGLRAFNCAPELSSLFAFLKKTYTIQGIVETGTYHGDTTILFSFLFDEVHTIEIAANTYEKSKKRLAPFSNIQCHLGSSDRVLKEILPDLRGKRILFYLDAHWQEHWPLQSELIEIGKTHHDNCIIVIDDFKVPGRRDILFDQYGENACSYEYVKKYLDKVFSAYSSYYIVPKDYNCRAKFLVFPEKLELDSLRSN